MLEQRAADSAFEYSGKTYDHITPEESKNCNREGNGDDQQTKFHKGLLADAMTESIDTFF